MRSAWPTSVLALLIGGCSVTNEGGDQNLVIELGCCNCEADGADGIEVVDEGLSSTGDGDDEDGGTGGGTHEDGGTSDVGPDDDPEDSGDAIDAADEPGSADEILTDRLDTGVPFGGRTDPPDLPDADDEVDTGDMADPGEPADTGGTHGDTGSDGLDTAAPSADTVPHDDTGSAWEDTGAPMGDSAPSSTGDEPVDPGAGIPPADTGSATADSADTGAGSVAVEICDGVDNDGDGTVDIGAIDAVEWFTDADGDGYGGASAGFWCAAPAGATTVSGDCDDNANYIYPGATEWCDGIDTDCDGTDDDDDAVDALTWYADLDGDSYGDSLSPWTTCYAPEGYVPDAADCDDQNAEVSPEATESCNGIDDDCSGVIDDNAALAEGGDCAPDVSGGVTGTPDTGAAAGGDTGSTVDEDPSCEMTWYADVDGDGYGDGSTGTWGCAPDASWVTDGSDCDDTDPDASPGALEYCDGIDNDCDGTIDEAGAADAPAWYPDGDGDGYGESAGVVQLCEQPSGYVAVGGDCDDHDAAVHPGAVEYCDGIDNDCNQGADESTAVDATIWFIDHDGDGYAGSDTRSACTEPANGYATAEDCDDTDDSVYPGAIEVCNDVDDDCNGVVDDSASTGAGWWYADADGDAFGDASVAIWSCSTPEGYVQNGEDCDDSNSSASPAHRERCDGVDNDCDGSIDESGASGELTWYADTDGDGYGDASSTVDACSAPTGYTGDNDDCDDTDAAVSPAAVEICGDGIDNDCDGRSEYCGPWGERELANADASFLGGAEDDEAGRSVAFLPDADGDGLTDLLIGARWSDLGGTGSGAVYVVAGAPDGSANLDAAMARLIGEASGDEAGWTVAAVADIDGDGLGEAVVGSYLESSVGSEAGSVYLVSGLSGDVDLSSRRLQLTGVKAGDRAGYSLATLEDGTGDGVPDLLIGAPYESTAGTRAGAVYVASADGTGRASLSTATASFYGEQAYDRAGSAVGNPGDLDGDGISDLVVGAWAESSKAPRAGVAYIVYGPFSGSSSLKDADARAYGVASGNRAGWSVGGGSDIDGDGLDDALVGAPYAGKAYALSAPSGDSLLSAATVVFTQSETSFRAGTSVAGGGDLDADGYDDVLIGAPAEDENGAESGAVYVVAGPVSGAVDLDDAHGILRGRSVQDFAGTAIACNGDTDGDGLDDVLVGAPGADHDGVETGMAYLFYGAGR